MTREDRKHVTVQHDERTIAAAELQTLQNEDSLHASLSVDAGQLPPRTRTQLVDSVLDQPELTPGTRFKATVPAGDGEMLDRIRERCRDVETHRAGVSLIVDATVDDPPRETPS
jgi:hypothetical protein